MSLNEYARRLALRWRLIASTTALFLIAVSIYSALDQPIYESQTKVFVSSSGNVKDLSGQLAAGIYAQQRVLSYAAIAGSIPMAEAIVRSNGLDIPPREIPPKISTEVDYGTVLFTIRVRDHSAQQAHDIAQAILDNYDNVLADVDSARSKFDAVQISVMNAPTLPENPVSPRVGMNLMFGLIAGLLLGIAAAALRDLADDSIGAEDVVDGGLATLGRIPRRTHATRRDQAVTLVTASEHTPEAEAFRQLRLNLRFASLDQPPRSLVVTSPTAADGKSFVSANLAAVYASAGQKVILVDLDLRRPSQATMLGLDSRVGVMSVLLGQASLEQAIQTHTQSGVSVLVAGPLPPNPAAILGTKAVVNLIRLLREEFDIVIVDTPPAALFVDSREIAQAVDGVVVIVQARRTKLRSMVKVVDQLRLAGGNVLGAVVNRDRLNASTRKQVAYYDRDAR